MKIPASVPYALTKFPTRTFLLTVILWSQRLAGQSMDSFDLKEGEAQYAVMVNKSKVSLYGSCWKTAIERLHVDCAELTGELQSRLSLLFTNCFLQEIGVDTYSCPTRAEISTCIDKMNPKWVTSYATFYTHTQNMCFFLKSNLWRHQTEETIGRLVDVSSVVVPKIERMMESQKKSLESVEKLASHGRDLNSAMAASKSSLEEFMRESQERSNNQHLNYLDIAQEFANMRALVYNQIALIYSIAFYIAGLLISFLVTSAERSAGARGRLISMFTVCVFAETFVLNYGLAEATSKSSTAAQDAVYFRTWLFRYGVIAVSSLVLAYYILTYRDRNQASYDMMIELKQSNQELKLSNQELKLSNQELKACVLNNLNSSTLRETANETPRRNISKLVEPLNETQYESGYEAEEDEQVLEPVPTQSTPNTSNSVQKSEEVVRKRRPGRPKKSTSSDISTSMLDISPPTGISYNLRERRSRQPSPAVSSVMGDESPRAFAMIVKHLAETSKQTSSDWLKMVTEKKKVYKRTLGAQLSSDDDIY